MCNIPDIVCKLESIDKSNIAIPLSKIGKYYLCSISYFLFFLIIFFPKEFASHPFYYYIPPSSATLPILLTFPQSFPCSPFWKIPTPSLPNVGGDYGYM